MWPRVAVLSSPRALKALRADLDSMSLMRGMNTNMWAPRNQRPLLADQRDGSSGDEQNL